MPFFKEDPILFPQKNNRPPRLPFAEMTVAGLLVKILILQLSFFPALSAIAFGARPFLLLAVRRIRQKAVDFFPFHRFLLQ